MKDHTTETEAPSPEALAAKLFLYTVAGVIGWVLAAVILLR